MPMFVSPDLEECQKEPFPIFLVLFTLQKQHW